MALTDYTIHAIYEMCHEQASKWNGENPGKEEDIAHIANGIIQTVESLVEQLNELEEIL